MRHFHYILWLVAALLLVSCGKDFQDDIDKLNNQHSGIDRRVGTLETQVSAMNTKLTQISALAAAVEQGFYVTQVRTTAEGYELKLSNGSVITLQNAPDNRLTPMPAVSMTQIGGLYYWTLNGVLLSDSDGNPIRSTVKSPVVKYDYTLMQWVISVDGGATFTSVNEMAGIVINDTVLMQVINSYVRQHSTTIFSQQMLFRIISTYIQQNYAQLFNVKILDEVVVNYVDRHWTKLFRYELLEKIFNQYNFSYYTSQIDVDVLVKAIITYIQENKEILLSNEVLFEIISSYIEVNKTTIFSNELLLEVINNFIRNNENYIDVELLTQVVNNYIDQHQEVVFNTETVVKLVREYVKKYYTEIFSQNILLQVINYYVTENYTTIFDQKVIEEVVNQYLKNDFYTYISKETVFELVNNYVKVNGTTIINRDVLVEIIANYFEKNYDLFIKKEDISVAVNNYIDKHKTTLIDVDVIEGIVYSYLEKYYKEVFSYDMLSQIIVNYFDTNKQVLLQYVSEGSDIIKSVDIEDECCSVMLSGGTTIRLVLYDDYARLRDRVQSAVLLPAVNVNSYYDNSHNMLTLRCMVTPIYMANVISEKCRTDEMSMELVVTDGNGNISRIPVSYYSVQDDFLYTEAYMQEQPAAIALHIVENKLGGTDIMTEFTTFGGLNCSGIPDAPTTPTPVPGNTNIKEFPYPNIQTTINECGNCVATLSLTGIQNPSTGEWLSLYGTGLPMQNVWIDVDDQPRGNVVTNLEDNTTMVQNDIVFTVDNSGSMGEEADAIARDIMSWAQTLTNKKLSVQFGVVGYGGYIDGAMNLTSASALSSYLNTSTGVNRTKKFGGSDATALANYAKNYTHISNSVDGYECGALAIRFANDYFAFRNGANRIYINFTDEPNQPNGNANYSVEWFKSQNNWPATKGTVHTVFSASSNMSESTYRSEMPWRISLYTGGTYKFVKSNASDLQLDKLPVSEAITHSYTIKFLVPRELYDGYEHNVRITVISIDNSVRGVLNIKHVFGKI